MAVKFSIKTYSLYADSNGIVYWEAPDGKTYKLNPDEAEAKKWLIVLDKDDKPVMAYLTKRPKDGVLAVSLDGANSISATLLRDGDLTGDGRPGRYYFGTDDGRNNKLERPALVLGKNGVITCPVEPGTKLKVICFG